MHLIVEPSPLSSGVLTVPGDKSISHRALMLGAIGDGLTTIHGFLPGEDCLATMRALRALGVRVEQHAATRISVVGNGMYGLQAPSDKLDMENSGTAMRLFAGLLCGQPFASELVGDESLSGRPMDRVIKPLTAMGASIESTDGKPPLKIGATEGLSSIVYKLPVASAQVKSAVLLAGLFASGATVVIEPAVTRDHTERMLRHMGVDVRSGESQITLAAGQSVQAREIQVPTDLSSAAFIILAGVAADDCEITITGVGVNPTRSGVIDILREMGANISLENVRLYGEEPVADLIVRSSDLHGIDVAPDKVSLAIDEFPVLFVAAAMASGQTRFSGIGELRVKESDRIAVMANGLRNLGINVEETDDGALINGGRFSGGTVDSFGDHRVAMSIAVAGTKADWPVRIEDTSAVDTSFPGFADCLRSIGANISVIDDVPGDLA